MTLFDLVGTAATAILSGGATGLLGAGIEQFFGWLKTKQELALLQAKQAHEIAMRQQDALLMDKEWAGRLRVAQTEGDTARDVADSKAFEQTMLREPERYSYAATLTIGQQWWMVILDFLRGIVRPALTVYLGALVTMIWIQVSTLTAKEDLTPEDVMEIWKTVVATVLYVWTTVTLWWFGTRNRQTVPAGLSGKPSAK